MRTAIRQVMDVFAELDRKMVARRLRDGRLAKAAAGRKAVGDYPFGYLAMRKGRERDARPTEEEQRPWLASSSCVVRANPRRTVADAPRATSWSAAASRSVSEPARRSRTASEGDVVGAQGNYIDQICHFAR
jgi:hypothetical protein